MNGSDAIHKWSCSLFFTKPLCLDGVTMGLTGEPLCRQCAVLMQYLICIHTKFALKAFVWLTVRRREEEREAGCYIHSPVLLCVSLVGLI